MSKFELNKGDQFIFALDVSRSMGETDCPGGMSRINFAKESAKVFASEAAKYDPDGADYITFGVNVKTYYNQTAEQAHKLIDSLQANEGGTDTAGMLRAVDSRVKELRASGITENICLMIVTDGEPNDQEATKQAIRDIAASLPDGEGFGMTFLTVGVVGSGLRAFLTDLDDNLNAAHDIVDVKDFMEVNFTQAFDGAIND